LQSYAMVHALNLYSEQIASEQRLKGRISCHPRSNGLCEIRIGDNLPCAG
jgi:hypothetical protein